MNLRQVLLLFVVSVAVRLGYQLLVLYWDGSFITADSLEYIRLARGVMETGELAVLRSGVVIPQLERMPLYPYFLASAFSLANSANIALAVGLQGAIDAGTVIGVALMARAIDDRWTLPAAGLACVWPNLVIHAALVLTDTLYVTFLTFGLCACLWAARGRGTIVLLSLGGLCLGLALMTRPVLMFYPAVLFPALAYLLRCRLAIGWLRAGGLALIPVLLIGLCATPRLLKSYRLYGRPVLSVQSGVHALYWVYPCLHTPWDCADRETLNEVNEGLVRQRLQALQPEARSNPAVIDQVQRATALEQLRTLSVGQVASGLVAGVSYNLFHTSFSRVGYQLNLKEGPLLGPGSRDGAGLVSRAILMFSSGAFTKLWLGALAMLALSRLLQLVGLCGALLPKVTRAPMVFLLATVVYHLAINGPIGNAKYRLPMEPALIVFLVAGAFALRAAIVSRPRRGRVRPAV